MTQIFINWLLKKIIKQKYPKAGVFGVYRVERRKDGYHIIY